jgi:IS5 family transposase
MDAVVPWISPLVVIKPHNLGADRRDRPPMQLQAMPRIDFMQQWLAPSDPGMKEALNEIGSVRLFARQDQADDAKPDESTIRKFRHFLEHLGLTGQMMNVINETLVDNGLLLKGGTTVDATMIHAPPSAQGLDGTRDPEMHQTKKGNQGGFGTNIHAGADVHSRPAHTGSVIPANESDISQLSHLVGEDDRAVFGDKGYVNNTLTRLARKVVAKVAGTYR